MKTSLPNEINEIISLVTDVLKKHFGNDFKSLALFGSWARREEKEDSDIDLFAIIDNLPESHFERSILLSSLITQKAKRKVLLIGKSRDEFLSDIPSLYLDLAFDAVILFDQERFLQGKLEIIRELTKKAGLEKVQRGNRYFWKWKTPPKRGWQLTWEGFSELP